jgi:hypothetical protein
MVANHGRHAGKFDSRMARRKSGPRDGIAGLANARRAFFPGFGEGEHGRIHTVALAGWIGTIREDVTKVSIRLQRTSVRDIPKARLASVLTFS